MFCLQIPLPKIPPLILAVIPISDSNSAEDLLVYMRKVINGLLGQGIRVVSYSCDGTEVERALTRSFLRFATSTVMYTFCHPKTGRPALVIKIFFFDGQPIIMMQDSKHALKTYRNNLFTGARLLIIGNYVLFYEHIRRLRSPRLIRSSLSCRSSDVTGGCACSGWNIATSIVGHTPRLTSSKWMFYFARPSRSSPIQSVPSLGMSR
jgi:hypothetical protein